MNQLRFTRRFRLDYRRSLRRGCDGEKLKRLLALLRRGAPLPLDCRDAAVKGTKARACRVEPGWVLVYQTKEGMVTLLRMKLIPGKRPKAAPPLGLWFKTLLRSPVKTALTVLLLAVAAFLLLDNLSSYAMQTQAIRQAEQKVEGVLTVERSPVSLPMGATSAWYLLTDPTNPGETYSPKTSYETLHHEALTASDLEALDVLPYIDGIDRRYMTAGVSADYTRHDGPLENYSYTDRLVIEATAAAIREKEDYAQFWATDGAFTITLTDVTLLAGDGRFLEEQQAALSGQARLIAATIPAEKVGSFPGCAFSQSSGGGSGSVVECLDYDVTKETLQSVQPGRRYIFVVRAPRCASATSDSLAFYLGDDSLKGWWPYITDVTDLPEYYLETEEFAPLRELIQVTNDDLHTFDMVYTDDMASIRRVARHQITLEQGRFLGPADAGKAVCVVSQDFLERNGLSLGDTVTFKLGNYLMEQYGPLGAVAVTRGRYASEWTERSFTVVGAWKDSSDRHWQEQEHYSVYSTGSWQDQDPFWSYSDNAVFVPSSFLPAGCDLENHSFRPGEVSFLVREAANIGAFTEEGLPLVEALGLKYAWNDAGWPIVAEKLAEARSLSRMKLLIFTGAALLAVALTVYLFLFRRRQEYAILRALGTPRKAAARALWLPLLALAAFSAALGLGAAWLRSGAAVKRSAAEFAEAGLEAMPEAHIGVYLLGALGLLAAVCLLSAVYLGILGSRSPLRLMQEGGRQEKGKAGAAALPVQPGLGAAAVLALPMTITGKPVKGFLRRYIFRHARRAGVKTLLTLLLAALLVGAVGQLTVLRERYAQLMGNVRIEASFYDGLSLYRAETLMESGLVRDPVYMTSFREGELEMDPAEVIFTNRLDSVVSDPVAWLEGWDEEKAMGEKGRICILPASAMEKYGIELGDEVRVNEFDCVDYLQFGHDVVVNTTEEAVALRDRYRPFYTVVGRVETNLMKPVVYAPAAAFGSYSFFGTTLYLDSATFVLNNYRDVDKVRQMAAEIQYTAKKPPVFTMDTSDADRIYRVYRLIETLYPLTVAAALILGTLLPVLMILQEQKEAAILRALGWSKKLTLRRLTLEQALLCLAGLALAIVALFAVNGLGFLGVILVPILYVIAHFALCVIASAAISASILQKSPMRLLQAKE